MAYSFENINVGDKFVPHQIRFAIKVGTEYVRGQVRYVRVSPFAQVKDEVDDLIMQAIELKYSGARDKTVKVYTKNNGSVRSNFLRPLEGHKRVRVPLSIFREENLDVNNPAAGAERRYIDIEVDLYYEDKNTILSFGDVLSKQVFVSDNAWDEMKAQLRSTFVPFSQFFR